jgi:hypothetical protein
VWNHLRRSPQQRGASGVDHWQGCQIGEDRNNPDPAISVLAREVVFLDEFIWDVRELDANIFRLEHRHVKVEVLEVDGAEPGAFPGEHAVEEELDEVNQGCDGTHIARISNPVATNGDAGAVGIILFRTDSTDNHGVADFLALVGRDVLVVNDEEGVGTRYPLVSCGMAQSNALAEPT